MINTSKRIRNPESLNLLGKQLRAQREQARIAQSKVRGMRQATVSKIENGGDVTLDTFVSYAAALGLEVVLLPIGQTMRRVVSIPQTGKPVDLLDEFNDLRDEEL